MKKIMNLKGEIENAKTDESKVLNERSLFEYSFGSKIISTLSDDAKELNNSLNLINMRKNDLNYEEEHYTQKYLFTK